MKVFTLIFGFLISALFVSAQNWNPYITEAAAKPDPMIPIEFDGEGLLSFHIGNSGNKPLHLVTNQEMTLTISISDGIPNDSIPLMAIGGTWAEKFKWTYMDSFHTFIATQIQEIPENSEGTITIKYKPTVNSRKGTPSNGINVNLQPPPYSNGVNLTSDDQISYYTYVQAKDYSDAPASYGVAVHEINSHKNRKTDQYENYLFLGQSVDAEPQAKISAKADGDDNDLSDDEDGVIFPELVRGDTVQIPVTVTVHDFGTGLLNAWFDWNGDGDFSDTNEKILATKTIFKTDTVYIETFVPDSAVINKPTFARFRIGDNRVNLPNEPSAWGEVEDYQINILKNSSLSVKKVLTSNNDRDYSGTISNNDIMTFDIIVTNNLETEINNLTINDNVLIPGNRVCNRLLPGKSCILTGTHKITQDDLIRGNISSKTVVNSNETDSILYDGLLYLIKR